MIKYNNLPDGWKLRELKEVSQIILGQSPPSTTYNNDGLGLPFFQGKTEFGDVYPTPKKWCSSPNKIALPDDILISVRAPVGPTNLCKEISCIGRGLAAIRAKEKILYKYIFYFLRLIENEWDTKATGTTFKAITKNVLQEQDIPIPPHAEQVFIVEKIEKLFSQLDAGVGGLKRIQGLLKQYRASVLKAAFEGRLAPQDPRDEPAGDMLGRMGKEPLRRDDLPTLPNGWVWVELKDIGKIITGTTPRKSNSAYYGEDYAFFKPTDLNGGFYLKNTREKLSKLGIKRARLLPEKSILVTCIGATIGKTGFMRVIGATNQQINSIVPSKIVLPEFLFFICISPQFQKLIIDNSSATTLPIINKSRFEQLVIPLPPFREQKRIFYEIEKRLSIIEILEHSIKNDLLRANSLRQTILKKAFEGKLING